MASTSQMNEQPEKPRQVVYAVYLIYASIVLGFLYALAFAATDWQATIDYYTDPLQTICFGLGYLVSIYIAVMIAAGRSWARFLIVIDFIISFLNGAAVLEFYTQYPLPAALFVLSTFLRLTAIILLFQAPANAWFKEMNEHIKSGAGQPKGKGDDLEGQPVSADPASVMSFEAEKHEVPTVKAVAYAAVGGAAIGILNAAFWALTLPPKSNAEMQLLLFLIASGLALGAVMGALIGTLFLRIARRSPARDPLRWTLFGGILGGMLSFSCGFFSMMLSLA